MTKGDPRIKVAVLDGPVDDGSGSGAGPAPAGAVAHGTLVASLISGSRDGAVTGIAPGCTALPIPIFLSEAPGPAICSQDTLANAIRTAVAQGAHIVNVSASQQSEPLALSTPLSAALQEASARDVLVVAAAGNQGCACDTIPASVAGVLAVGAHDDRGAPLLISNWGPSQRSEGLLAPGAALPGACAGGGVCRGTGTSFATAVVSGIAALLVSADIERGMAPSGSRTKRALLDSSDHCRPETTELCATWLGGRLNVGRAADMTLGSSQGQLRREGIVTSTDGALDQDTAPGLSSAFPGREPGPAAKVRGSPSPAMSEGLRPADCGCGCGGKCNGDCKCGGHEPAATARPAKPQLVYAIGRLGVSFISQTRRDAIWRSLNVAAPGTVAVPEIDLKPITSAAVIDLLRREPWHAQSLVWTLSRTEVAMFAIIPSGAFAAETFEWMVGEWADADVEFISLPGVIAGQVTTYDGMTIDAVVPDRRGMFSWNTGRYVGALRDQLGAREGTDPDEIARRIDRFLRKIQFRIRNRGLLPEERALNAAATNAFNISDVIVQAGSEGLAFKDISVERSPLNRPGSEYYDVLLTFFEPGERLRVAPLVARFTVDVSDTVPVVVGEPVSWYEY